MELNRSGNVSKNYKKFPYEIISVDDATKERVLSHFGGPFAGMFQVGPEKWIMPKLYPQCAEELYNFEARPDDIWISTFSRSGTTWTQEMIWLLCNNLNYKAAKATPLTIRFPFFEMGAFTNEWSRTKTFGQHLNPPSALELLPEMTSPRFIKTHFPIKLMPHDALAKGCKIVYVARNPRDVIASHFNFFKNQNPFFDYTGNFQELTRFFMDNLMSWGPHLEHIKDGWNHRNDDNVLFLFYEDLKMDLANSLKKLASFLERPFNDSDLPDLMEHLDIKTFRENDAVKLKIIDNFIGSGQIGGNREITVEFGGQIDEWTNAQLEGSGIKFPHQEMHQLEPEQH